MKRRYTIVCSITLLILIGVFFLIHATNPLTETYGQLSSATIIDRHGTIIYQEKNVRDGYSIQLAEYPETLQAAVLRKEDAYFYLHPGVNPIRITRALFYNITSEKTQGASTITQQLVKILSAHEQERTVRNKITETLLAFGLELRYSKKEILTMYLNSVNLGNQANGFAQASFVYFNKPITALAESDLLSLVATLSNPSAYNPWETKNVQRTQSLASKHKIETRLQSATTTAHRYNTKTAFELTTLLPEKCNKTCSTTIDATLTENIRSLVQAHAERTAVAGGTEMAVVVISIPENEVLTVVGSPNPFDSTDGSQINMAIQSRPIGSTIKPFIYAEAFTRGARPYSLITDQEYKYPIGSGFSLYPKNFDGTYQGEISLEFALANSLNTPSVKLLEFVSLENFYELLENKMHFTPINPMDSYAYGIALGGLEMDLLTLTHYFTTFPQHGTLHPLHIVKDTILHTPQGSVDTNVKLYSTSTIEMLNSILTERSIGAQQFGLRSNLLVSGQETAVKTGTSRDFHDSWAVGYTPDYVVGVWLGNASNKPLDKLSGSVGAGPLWRQTMELLQNSAYNKQTAFSFQSLTPYTLDNTTYYGLADDTVDHVRTFLVADNLIIRPHGGDEIAFDAHTSIELHATESVHWSVDKAPLGTGSQMFWSPPEAGVYTITAATDINSESRVITVIDTTLWEAL